MCAAKTGLRNNNHTHLMGKLRLRLTEGVGRSRDVTCWARTETELCFSENQGGRQESNDKP